MTLSPPVPTNETATQATLDDAIPSVTPDASILKSINDAMSKFTKERDDRAKAMFDAMQQLAKDVAIVKAKSYASVTSNKAPKKASETLVPPKPHGVKPVYSCVFRPTDATVSGNDARIRFNSEPSIDMRKFNCGVRMTPLSNNVTRLDFDAAATRDAVIDAINATDALKADAAKKKKPRVILKGVPNSIPEAELINYILKQNTELASIVTDANPSSSIKLLFQRRNPKDWLRNYVLEVTPGVRNVMLTMKRIAIDKAFVRVTDFSPFIQCPKCFNFGHSVKYCKQEQDDCGHCAQRHSTRTCPTLKDAKTLKCVNCQRHNTKYKKITSTTHSASSACCPHVAKLTKMAHEKIDYGE